MSIFDTYGIKEVADVTFWDTTTGAPVLYLDTLKVSTIEQTADQTEARGGKGNAPLIIWDFGKEITITIEDALFSMKSMQIMMGAKGVTSTSSVIKTSRAFVTSAGTPPAWAADLSATFYDETGTSVNASDLKVNAAYIAQWIAPITGGAGEVITISAQTFPGTYKITGTTYARSQSTGKDEFFDFIVPLAKVNSEQTITMQAEGKQREIALLNKNSVNCWELLKTA